MELTDGRRLRIAGAHSLIWRDDRLVCLSAEDEEFSFDPSEVASFSVLPDAAPRIERGGRPLSAAVAWLRSRKVRQPRGKNDRVDYLKALIAARSEGLDNPRTAHELLGLEDSELGLRGWLETLRGRKSFMDGWNEPDEAPPPDIAPLPELESVEEQSLDRLISQLSVQIEKDPEEDSA
jgi:hypothetical protein